MGEAVAEIEGHGGDLSFFLLQETSNNGRMSAVDHLSLDQAVTLARIGLAAGVCSLFGSALILNAWSMLGKGRGFTTAVVLLALGDFLWAVSSITASSLLLFDAARFTLPVCVGVRVLFQWGAWSSLVWSLGILVLVLDSSRDGEPRRTRLWFSLFAAVAYGGPLVVMAVELSLQDALFGQSRTDGHCFLQDPFNLYLWFVPCTVVYGLALCMFLVVLYRFRRSVSSLSVPVRTSLFPLVMLLTWGLNIVSSLVGAVPFGLICTHVALLTAQGFWDAIIYGATNGRFRAFYFKRVWRTLVLFVFGPLLVLPLLLRRGVKYGRKRCCGGGGEGGGEGEGEEGRGALGSSAEGESLLRSDGSFFPLSRSFSHPVPDTGIVASLPKSLTAAAARGHTPVQSRSMVDASAFVSDDDDDDDGGGV